MLLTQSGRTPFCCIYLNSERGAGDLLRLFAGRRESLANSPGGVAGESRCEIALLTGAGGLNLQGMPPIAKAKTV